MAVDGYMYFEHYKNQGFLPSESQVDVSKSGKGEILFTAFEKFKKAAETKKDNSMSSLFEVEDFGFGIEQVLNIGSQSTGAGAGRVTFNPFTINRKIDMSSPQLYEMACSGTPFQEVGLALRKGSGGDTSGKIYLVFLFKLVAVKTITWSYDDESPKEAIEFEYGGLQVWYSPQNGDGTMTSKFGGGWNRVRNVVDKTKDPIV